MRLVVHPRAFEDINRLTSFLTDMSPSAALRLKRRLADRLEALLDLPYLGRPLVDPLRELAFDFGSTVYVIRYAVDPRAGWLIVLRIWNARERTPPL